MQKPISWLLSLVIIFQPVLAAGQTVTVESNVAPESIQVVPDEAVSYWADDTLGGRTYMEFNVQTRQWLAVDSNGDIRTGQIPDQVIDEYRTNTIPLPCFAGPWAAAGCIGAAGIATAVAFFACDRMSENNVRRIQSQCPPGSVAEINQISMCGTVEAGGCVPIDKFTDPESDPADPGTKL